MPEVASTLVQAQSDNKCQIRGIDYTEFYVSNARQAAYFYCTAFGLTLMAYAGLETGTQDSVSYVVGNERLRLVLTSPLTAESPIARSISLHGDSVKDIAFQVEDAAKAFEQAVASGAQPVMEPTFSEDQAGRVAKATIQACGDVVHTFVQREDYQGTFLPGYVAASATFPASSTRLMELDHVALSVSAGTLAHMADFYTRVLGFHQVHTETVITEFSGMNSRVMQNSSGTVKFPISEPIAGKRRSQIEEFLMFHGGSGVQHLAISSSDIIKTIQMLKANGIEFLNAPGSYYDMLEARVGHISEDIAALRMQNILVDRDEWGYLLQIFSKPLQSRPTFFFEVIQRREALGFGSGNIKALFQAIEREQALRGTL